MLTGFLNCRLSSWEAGTTNSRMMATGINTQTEATAQAHRQQAVLVYLLCMVCALLCLLPVHSAAASDSMPETPWEALIPPDWKPDLGLDDLGDLDSISDDDPRAEQIFNDFMEKWATAPANPAMNGKKVKLYGFIAPLDWEEEGALKEFLLVPYFGACIHLPPPPANQIVYVRLKKAVKGLESMSAIWITGTLKIDRRDSATMGTAGYLMEDIQSIRIDPDA